MPEQKEAGEQIVRRIFYQRYEAGNTNITYNPNWDIYEPIIKESIRREADDWLVFIVETLGYRKIPELTLIGDEEIPYNTDVHLDAGIYSGLYRKKFIEGAEAQLAHTKKELGERKG